MTNMLTLGLLGAAIARMERMGDDYVGDMDPGLTAKDVGNICRAKAQTCNLSEEQIAERDRPKSRQERRHLERLRRKGRA